MRLSVDTNDVAYRPDSIAKARGFKIFLNGIEQKFCITADEEQGIVHRLVLNADGKVTKAPYGDGGLVESVHGEVKIVLKDENGPS